MPARWLIAAAAATLLAASSCGSGGDDDVSEIRSDVARAVPDADAPVGAVSRGVVDFSWRFLDAVADAGNVVFSPLSIVAAFSMAPYPASHGCVRVTNAAIDFIWDADLAPIGTEVWVHGTSPR